MRKILFVILISCLPILVVGQTGDTLHIQRGRNGDIVFASFGGKADERKISKGSNFLKMTLKAPTQSEFRVKKQDHDELGMTHVTYQQYHRGLRVEGGTYKLHGKADDIESMNGKYERIELGDSKSSISEASALASAMAYIGAKKFSWQDEGSEQFIKSHTKDLDATYFPKGELVIVRARTTEKDWRVAWRFQISSIEPVSGHLVWVDANSGAVINVESLICDSNSTASAQTRYSGTRTITTDSYSNGYRLFESRNGVNVITRNMETQWNYSLATEFIDNDNNWTATEYNNFDQDQVAWMRIGGRKKYLTTGKMYGVGIV